MKLEFDLICQAMVEAKLRHVRCGVRARTRKLRVMTKLTAKRTAA